MKKILPVLLALLILLAGCGKEKASEAEEAMASATPAPVETPAPKIIGYSAGEETAYNKALEEELRILAENAGYQLTARYGKGDVAVQAADIELLLAADAKAILLVPAETEGLSDALDSCAEKGVPTVSLLAPVNGLVNTLVTPDYARMGQKGARLCAQVVKEKEMGKCEVFLCLLDADSFVMQWMYDGFAAEAKEQSALGDVKIRHFADGNMEDFSVDELGEARVVFCQSPEMAAALKEKLGSAAEPVILTAGGDADTLSRVGSGEYAGCVFYGVKEGAQKGMEQALAAIGGQEPASYAEMGLGTALTANAADVLGDGQFAEPAEE